MVVDGAISHLTYFKSRGWYDVLQEGIGVVGTTSLFREFGKSLDSSCTIGPLLSGFLSLMTGNVKQRRIQGNRFEPSLAYRPLRDSKESYGHFFKNKCTVSNHLQALLAFIFPARIDSTFEPRIRKCLTLTLVN